MKFYGFYISKNNERLRNKIIESGIYPLAEFIKDKNEEAYLRMLNGIEGKQVFLFSLFQDVKMGDSPFTEYFSGDEYNFESKISENKAYAKGVVRRVNHEDISIEVDWDRTYQPITWYRFVLTEPVVFFDTENSKHEQIYKIVFKNQPMDYEWWATNGNWSDKRLKKLSDPINFEQDFKSWLSSRVQEIATVERYTNCLNGDNTTYSEFRIENKFPSNVFEMNDINEIDTFYKRLIRQGDLSEWNRAHHASLLSAALSKYRDFLISINQSESTYMNNAPLNDLPSLNQILYGPPGTGKTYNTVSEALNILGDSDVDEWESKPVKSIEELKQAFPGQVEFVTFHQSFSYEDFVEGLRANSNNDGQVSYSVEEGVFKRIGLQAMTRVYKHHSSKIDLKNKKIWKMSLGNTLAGEDFIFDECVENDYVLLGYGGDIDFTGCDTKRSIKDRLSKEDDEKIGDNNYALTSVNTFKHVMKKGDLIIVSDGNSKFRAVAEIKGNYEFLNDETRSGFKQKRAVTWLQTYSPSLPAANIFDKSLSQMTLYQLKSGTLDFDRFEALINKSEESITKKNSHVLIIDEINRGNISRIFGELITLIEPSKRAGSAEEISVTLPYSKEPFSVPDNLYIIGTMNTADRSLAMMDTALRRRFDFIEMMPNANLLKDYGNAGYVDGVDLVQLLTIINKRIEALYDREHTIGHAFFMSLNESSSVNDLANIFKNKILPLLEEYFYDDWEKIRLVLADQAKTDSRLQFYQEVEGIKQDDLFPQSNDFAIPSVNKSYRRQAPYSSEAYIQIYEITASNSLNEDGSSE